MRTLYIECNMGAAGDMLMAALYELLDDKEGFLNVMNHLGLPGVRLEAQPGSSCPRLGPRRLSWTISSRSPACPP